MVSSRWDARAGTPPSLHPAGPEAEQELGKGLVAAVGADSRSTLADSEDFGVAITDMEAMVMEAMGTSQLTHDLTNGASRLLGAGTLSLEVL